jgi:hypothetical protein
MDFVCSIREIQRELQEQLCRRAKCVLQFEEEFCCPWWLIALPSRWCHMSFMWHQEKNYFGMPSVSVHNTWLPPSLPEFYSRLRIRDLRS